MDMEFLLNPLEAVTENAAQILGVATVLAAVVIAVYKFFTRPKSEQMKSVREWLLWAVTDTERALGRGTGQIKLRRVYDLFLTRFGILGKFVSFDQFSSMVDDALAELRKLLESNQAVSDYVD